MEPILFVHGYSSESKEATPESIAGIYGSLPDALRKQFSAPVVEIDLSRYISLDDGVEVDDISLALQGALKREYPQLLATGFNAIVHSTGALVVRNWIRRFSAKPSPLRRLIYLAGANFGSGWAHLGQGQLAKWGRLVFDGGTERGVQVLQALEFGSEWTIDLHLSLLQAGSSLWDGFLVREAVLVGSQAHVRWFEAPVRYAKEDGSDGVVRVAASNVNFHYLRFGPTGDALTISWNDLATQAENHLSRTGERREFYELKEQSRPGIGGRPEIPLAIPYECAHSGAETGILTGAAPRDQVLSLVGDCLNTLPGDWTTLVTRFQQQTEATYAKVAAMQAPTWWQKWLAEPRAQYDKHAQVIFRIRDQNGRDVDHYDVFFDSLQGPNDASSAIKNLFQDTHVNDSSPNIITFYLRTDAFSSASNTWVPQLPGVNGCFLEVSGTEPGTNRVLFAPLRYKIDAPTLESWIVGHRTTLIDVELFRVPSPDVYKVVTLP